MVTLEDLEKAAVACLGDRVGEERAREMARRIMEYFGFDDMVVDNRIPTRDRDVFYMFEEVGLVSTFEDEAYVVRGKRWRIHYWALNKDKIREKAEAEKEGGEDDASRIYEEWDRWTEYGDREGGEPGGRREGRDDAG
ncbi:MAG: hypothetical protein J7L61_01565 [Thermoplasmata archaeon]|nr:hypothetical protein [Thermoplasmata archaeon]